MNASLTSYQGVEVGARLTIMGETYTVTSCNQTVITHDEYGIPCDFAGFNIEAVRVANPLIINDKKISLSCI